jgi:CHASE2 domain-containing sensor protein
LTVEQLKFAVKKAIEGGLGLAIFNSCDGLGLARDLADLHLPQLIVMREPVPDFVAQEFLKYFLEEFAGVGRENSLHLAVRSARERLQGLEGEFPCASWMPVICQHPAEVPPTWEELRYGRNGKRGERGSRSNWVKLGAAFLASLAATGLVLGVRQLGWLETLELKAFDELMQVRPDEGADPRLLVVEATSEDLKKYGFPLPDGILARVIEKIGAHQPPVIGLDIYRDVPVGTGNAELVKQLQNDRLIVICQVSQVNDPGIPPPPAVTDEDRHSFSDIVADSDGVIRRHLLAFDPNLNSPCRADHSFSLRLALDYLDETKGIAPDRTQYLKLRETVFKALQINPDKPGGAGGYRETDVGGYEIMLNYRTFKDVARRVTVTDVLNDQFDPNWVRDRIVLIGVTDPTKPDNHPTPYQTMPGVLIQAQMVSQILSAVLDKRPVLGVWPAWGEILWIWGWSFAGGALVWGWRKQLHRGVTIVGAIVILSGICYILLIQGSWVPLVPSALALVMTVEGLW